MTKKKIKNWSALFLTSAFAVILILSLYFSVPAPSAAKNTDNVLNQWDESVAAVRISDIAKLNALTTVNYTPDEFVQPGMNPRGEIMTLDSNFKPANRGTYQFTLLNLEPSDPNFNANAAALERFLQGDGYWHLTMYLSKVWSACNVYVDSVLSNRIGEIEGYDFSNYTDNYQLLTQTHKNRTEPLFLDLRFYTKRNAIPSGDPLLAAQVVTIHYETDGMRKAGLAEAPLIGTDAAVRAAVSRDESLLTAFVTIAALSLAVFVFLCFLKRTLSFAPQLLILFGVFFALLSGFMLSHTTAAPYFWMGVCDLAPAFVLFAAVVALHVKIKKIALWLLPAGFALISCILAFIAPFLPFGALIDLSLYLKIANIIVACIVIVFAGYSAPKNGDALALVNPLLAGVSVLAYCFLPSAVFIAADPMFWLLTAMIFVAVAVSFREFMGLERKNRYLTANLTNEVERQTNDLKAVLAERDNLLRHVSHDMKKPIASIESFLDILKKDESDFEQVQTINAVKQKTDELKRDFVELCHYAKLNFVAETSMLFDVNDAISLVYENLEPDCLAYGIVLKYSPIAMSVFGKKNALMSVLSNLILNAIEHAKCKTITLAVAKNKNFCHITVTDDGKGIAAGKDVFLPYDTENDTDDNLGIGLYICKSTMNSMGGDIFYKQKDGLLTFTVTVPIG